MIHPDHDKLVEAAEQHIDSLHTTLYGVMLDVTQPKHKTRAATWLVDQFENVLGVYTENHYKAVSIDITKNGQDPRTDDRLA